jgi:hypothetical protein
MIVEDRPLKTDNMRATGFSTVRIYYVFEARIKAPELISLMLASSRRYSVEVLQKMARKDARQGGKGRANAILTLSLADLKNAYHALPADRRSRPVKLGEYQLDGNVQAIIMKF